MIRNLTVIVLAVSLALPAVSAAQGSPRRPSTRPRVRVQTEGGPFGVYAFGDKHGRIGVMVDTKVNTAGDKVGARIEGITPGSPAEKAGLKAGDVITRFNGTALGGAESQDDERSGPGLKLIELAHDMEPGDTAQVEYRRGNDARRSEEHTSELQSLAYLVCRLLLEKKQNAELRHLGQVVLAGDEVEDVEDIDAQDAHVRAAASPTLFHHVGRGCRQVHQRYVPLSHA